MGRFSIQSQVFLFAGAFLTLVLIYSSVLIWENHRMTGAIHDSSAASAMAADLSGLRRELSSALEQVFLVEGGDLSALNRLEGVLGQGLSHLDSFDRNMAGTTGQLHEDLVAMRGDLDGLLGAIPAFRKEVGFVLARDLKARVVPMLQDHLLTLEMNEDILTTQASDLNGDMLAIADEVSAMIWTSLAVTVLSVCGLAFAFGRILARPIGNAVAAIDAIADHDYDTAIPGTERRDEIGRIAQRLVVLADRLGQADRQAEEERAVNTRRSAMFDTLGAAMSGLQNGDLSHRIEAADWRDLGEGSEKLCQDFNDLASGLGELVAQLSRSAKTVSRNSEELSDMASDMSHRAEVQAATLEESAAALEQLSVSVRSASDQAQAADAMVTEGRERAERGGEVMARAQQAMALIAKSSEQITRIIGVIDDIAFQTNLLALNAGVEAARAGESGKGFSVVASEVRSLAQRASESAQEIKELVSNSTAQVEDGERLVQETSDTLSHIVDSVNEVSELVTNIAASSSEQANGLQEINTGVAELDKVTQQNAAMVSQSSGFSQELNREATQLTGLLTRFDKTATETTTGAAPQIATDDRAHSDTDPQDDGSWQAQPVEPASLIMPVMDEVAHDDAVWKDF